MLNAKYPKRNFDAWNLNFLWSLALGVWSLTAHAADQPQWGEKHSRNMVSVERGLPDSFDPKSGANVKWSAQLGTQTHSTPIVAGGRVYIGTNNGEPRDPRHKGDRGVLMCFDEKDGRLLWQLIVPKIAEDPYMDWTDTGISSPVTVEGDRVYVVTNRGEVMCLDARGMANGNDGPFRDEAAHMTPKGVSPTEPSATLQAALGQADADILWIYDLVAGVGIWPHDAAHCSILLDGSHLYVNTGNGVDNTHRKIRKPDAPSLVVLDKKTGQLLARDGEPIGPNIFHCTWSSPSLGKAGKTPLVIFAGGNGIVYSFEPVAALYERRSGNSAVTDRRYNGLEPAILKKVWQFDPDPTGPKENVHRYTTNRREGPSNIYGMPVFLKNCVFVAGGGDVFWGKNAAWLKCLDAASGKELWSYPLGYHTLSTPAVQDGMVFVTDSQNTVHCVDAETGSGIWTHDAKGDMWASPLVADGKVYVGTRRGDFWVLAASREKKIISHIKLTDPISATATAANGTLYIATMTRLYVVQKR